MRRPAATALTHALNGDAAPGKLPRLAVAAPSSHDEDHVHESSAGALGGSAPATPSSAEAGSAEAAPPPSA